MSKRVFITGASGFTGQYVAAALAQSGYSVVQEPMEPGQALDITSLESCRRVLRQTQPDYLIHLAALSFVQHDDPGALYRVNTIGATNLLQALADEKLAPQKIIIASSANVYGNATTQPITEQQPPAPVNHYAASKLAMEHMAATWFDKFPIIITRPFNYTGVGQASHFLIPKIVQHFAQRSQSIKLGNLDVARDFSDARDIAAMYAGLLASSQAGHTFNLCSGHTHSLQHTMELMQRISGHTLSVVADPALMRSSEIKTLCGSTAKLHSAIGPLASRHSFEDTLQWMLANTLHTAQANP